MLRLLATEAVGRVATSGRLEPQNETMRTARIRVPNHHDDSMEEFPVSVTRRANPT